MIRQSSFLDTAPKLYLVATPIGNLEDITYRAVNVLKFVDFIYAEDTRTSGQLLKHYGIVTPMKSFHKHNETSKHHEVLMALDNGKSLALISDAGTPLISDPGGGLVETVVSKGYSVVPIPGPSASISALIVSGFTSHPYMFYGFLPSKGTQRNTALKPLRWLPYTLVFYESPHRIAAMIESLKHLFDNRRVIIARELTKHFEEILRFDLSEPVELSNLKGEMVVVVEGFEENKTLSEDTLIDRIELLIEDGVSEKDAIKQVAHEQNVKKNSVYMTYQTYKKQFKH
jgi:16S rRNA (cytidine1402-2'-O)-methyltransferase